MMSAESELLGDMEIAMERLEAKLDLLEDQVHRAIDVVSDVREWLDAGWVVVDDWKEGG